MKLTIKKGESLDHAIKYLQEYLEQYKEEYPILKGDMNIYVTLEGFGHRVCPENERELVLTGEETVDIAQNRKEKAYAKVKNTWNRVLMGNAAKIREVQHDIKRDKEYLATAAEKGKRADLIEKREKLKAKHEAELDELTQMYLLLQRFNNALEEGRAVIYYVKRSRSKSAYSYILDCMIVFDNIDGLYGFCDEYGFHKGSLPYSYERS